MSSLPSKSLSTKKLKKFAKRLKDATFVKKPNGKFYRCNHNPVLGPWSYGPTCGRLISHEIVHLTDGAAIHSGKIKEEYFCKEHVPKCYLSFSYDCDFYWCNVCYGEKCNYCSEGTCDCGDIL
jgi:hypothetical protein